MRLPILYSKKKKSLRLKKSLSLNIKRKTPTFGGRFKASMWRFQLWIRKRRHQASKYEEATTHTPSIGLKKLNRRSFRLSPSRLTSARLLSPLQLWGTCPNGSSFRSRGSTRSWGRLPSRKLPMSSGTRSTQSSSLSTCLSSSWPTKKPRGTLWLQETAQTCWCS